MKGLWIEPEHRAEVHALAVQMIKSIGYRKQVAQAILIAAANLIVQQALLHGETADEELHLSLEVFAGTTRGIFLNQRQEDEAATSHTTQN